MSLLERKGGGLKWRIKGEWSLENSVLARRSQRATQTS